jgi:uncharacterized protein (TIGR03083 family)
MRLSPRYDGEPIVTLDGPPEAVAGPFLRQRRRFLELAGSLSPSQWATPSRCHGWRVQDVIAHLTTTDPFWNEVIRAGVAGSPTRILTRFDPKTTPARLVDGVRASTDEDVLAAFCAATEALCATVESLEAEAWQARAEAPVGHVGISAVLHHALWDAWVHERDVLLPLGMEQEHHADEILAALRYVAALGPALLTQVRPGRTGALALQVENPAAQVVVTVADSVRVEDRRVPDDALVVRGDAVELVDALSVRRHLPHAVPDDRAWLVGALSEVFESSAPA